MTSIPKKIPDWLLKPGYNTKLEIIRTINELIEYLEDERAGRNDKETKPV